MDFPFATHINATKNSCIFSAERYVTCKGEIYKLKQGGTGSGVKFIKGGSNEVINFHKPYPSGGLKRYVLDQVIEKLRKDDLL